jgi:putative ABC transport system substrate-binding protein
MSYGPDTNTLIADAAHFLDKIFKGASPAELPVEQPTKFEFVLNLKTAKALGLAIPDTIVLLADGVIE